MNYPNKCNLPQVEKEAFKRPEKYKGFFMYQFENNDSFLIDAIGQFFKSPTYYIFNAAVEPGTGIKICKICKLALASDFGVISLSPENLNVFMETGLMFGLMKPCVLIYNKDKLKCKDPDKLPFDLNAFINIGYTSRDDLLDGLKREIPVFVSKIKPFTNAQDAIRKKMMQRLKALPIESLIFLKEFVGEGVREFTVSEFLEWQVNTARHYPRGDMFNELEWSRIKKGHPLNNLIGNFLLERRIGGITKVMLQEGYRDFLHEYLWSNDFDEMLENKVQQKNK